MKNKKKLWIGLGIGAVLLAFISTAVVMNIRKQTAQASGTVAARNAMPVQVEAAKKDTITAKVSTKGIVEADKKEAVYVNSSMRIKDVLVKVGDEVEQGQVLIQYDGKSLKDLEDQLLEAKASLRTAELNLASVKIPASENEVMQSKSGIAQAEKGLHDAQSAIKQTELTIEQLQRSIQEANKTVQNNETLFGQGAISQTELNASKEQLKGQQERLESTLLQKQSGMLAVENAKEQVKLAKEGLSITTNKLKDPKVKNQLEVQQNQIEVSKLRIQQIERQLAEQSIETISPIKGTIITVNAEKGASVNPNLPVVEIADLTQLIIKVDVSEYDAPTIQVGQKVEITGDSLGIIVYEGMIKKVAPTAALKRTSNGEEVVVVVEIAVKDQKTLLKPGYTIEAEIVTAHKPDVVVLPIVSIVKEKDGTQVVFIVKDDFTVEKRTVELGHYSDLYLEVTGVQEGEKIITNPTPKLKDGLSVKPTENKKVGDEDDKR